MKRPVIKDKILIAYVEYLEEQISSDATKVKFYRGVKRQLDILADEMLDPNFKVSLKVDYVQRGEKWMKEDSSFDQFFDMMTKGNSIIQSMKNFEAESKPQETTKGEEKKPLSEDSAENYLRK